MSVAVALVLVVVPAAAAHNGRPASAPNALGYLEAETYAAPDHACDPDADGEHTRPAPDSRVASGWVAFLPETGCGITWNQQWLHGACLFQSFTATFSGTTGSVPADVRVFVDGALVAKRGIRMNGGDPYQTFSFDTSTALTLYGQHAVRIDYVVWDPNRETANLEIDNVQAPGCVVGLP